MKQAGFFSPSENISGAGVCAFYNKENDCYLACEGRKLILSKLPYKWTLKPTYKNGFNICARDTGLLLDIDNAYVKEGTTIKVWPETGYDVQVWNIKRNFNGTFSILYSGDNRYCLGFSGNAAQLQIRDTRKYMQEWQVVAVSEPAPKEYFEIISINGVVRLQLPTEVSGVITDSRLQRWANELETAYFSYYELTSFRPFSCIVIEAYKPGEYFGWVFRNSNIIHINRDYIRDELVKMGARENDWNFCALHEMGHMFDFDKPWNFEAELMTDVKLAYVLEKNNAAAAPAEFDAAVAFRGKNIKNAYDILGNDFSKTYNIFGVAARFLEIKEDIGWEPFKKVFRFLRIREQDFADYSCSGRFELFVKLLSDYSNKDIRKYFTRNEWNTILNYCAGEK